MPVELLCTALGYNAVPVRAMAGRMVLWPVQYSNGWLGGHGMGGGEGSWVLRGGRGPGPLPPPMPMADYIHGHPLLMPGHGCP